MSSYLPLLVVPLLCAPSQLLYSKCGRRYDLGMITYIAAGAFSAAAIGGAQDARHIAISLSWFAVAMFTVRVVILSFGTPGEFTLVAIAQLWATPAFIEYQISQATTGSGIAVVSSTVSPVIVVLICALSALAYGVILSRSKIAPRLIALTDAPRLYSLLCGSPVKVATLLETNAAVTGWLAGLALSFVTSDLSSEMFRTEALWATIGPTLAGRASAAFVVASPIAVVALRFAVSDLFPARYSVSLTYVALALALAIAVTRAESGHRDAHA